MNLWQRTKPIRWLVEMLVITLVAYLILTTFVLRAYEVEQQSMEPTLYGSERLLVDKLTPNFIGYQLGDIVILQLPADENGIMPTSFIKRIVAVPGDTIELRNGQVLRNGEAMSEPYLGAQATLPATEVTQWQLEEDQYLVFGDNRANSVDSRFFGPLDRDQLLGRVWIRYMPFDKFGLVQ